MKNLLTSLGLTVLICGAFIFCFPATNHSQSSNEAKAQTNTTATPCPSPVKPSNIIDPCHPLKPPSPQELAKREQQIKENEMRRKRILSADYPLSSNYYADFDGDSKKDVILYQIKPFKDFYEGLLKITSATGKILWEDNFPMSKSDLSEWLNTMGDVDNEEIDISKWVKNAFNNKYNYAFETENRKIKKREIDETQIEYAAKLNKISAGKLKAEILAQKTNRIFSYRAEWREDLMQIVYVPSLKKFVCFARGYY